MAETTGLVHESPFRKDAPKKCDEIKGEDKHTPIAVYSCFVPQNRSSYPHEP